jgi:hypothetical protein
MPSAISLWLRLSILDFKQSFKLTSVALDDDEVEDANLCSFERRTFVGNCFPMLRVTFLKTGK